MQWGVAALWDNKPSEAHRDKCISNPYTNPTHTPPLPNNQQNKPVEAYRNTFANLALPLFAMAEPIPPKVGAGGACMPCCGCERGARWMAAARGACLPAMAEPIPPKVGCE